MVSRKESSKKIFLLVIIVSIFMLMCLSTNVKAESSQMQVGYVDVKSGLRVRSEASTKSEIIGYLKPGNLVEIMKKEGDFYMKVLNYGSLNVDYVYSVDHIIVGGETQHSSKLEVFSGGKGLNQSIALAKAGVPVYHAGIVGSDGDILLDACKEAGVNTKYIRRLPVKGGHTMIQVDKNAQNCIILYGGTNQMQTREFVDEVLADFGEGDYLLLQNEINMLDYIIDQAYEKKMKIVMNPSPFDDKLNTCDLGKIYLFLLNEIESEQITGYKDKDQILDAMAEKFPNARFVLTLGSDGAVYYDGKEKIFQDIFKVKALDTTAAGDTFTGYFIAAVIEGRSVQEALRMAAKASSIAVSRPGATPSIPAMDEVKRELGM